MLVPSFRVLYIQLDAGRFAGGAQFIHGSHLIFTQIPRETALNMPGAYGTFQTRGEASALIRFFAPSGLVVQSSTTPLLRNSNRLPPFHRGVRCCAGSNRRTAPVCAILRRRRNRDRSASGHPARSGARGALIRLTAPPTLPLERHWLHGTRTVQQTGGIADQRPAPRLA